MYLNTPVKAVRDTLRRVTRINMSLLLWTNGNTETIVAIIFLPKLEQGTTTLTSELGLQFTTSLLPGGNTPILLNYFQTSEQSGHWVLPLSGVLSGNTYTSAQAPSLSSQFFCCVALILRDFTLNSLSPLRRLMNLVINQSNNTFMK